jgi:DNA-binding NarL/FixJ family response regulator
MSQESFDQPLAAPKPSRKRRKDKPVQTSAETISVLLIDDHSLIVELVKTFLSADGGFTVTVAGDLASGLAKIREAQGFDVVLLDIVLPGLTGINDVAKVVQTNGKGAVVLFSGSVSASFVEKAVQAGARGYIPKTLPLRALTSAIRLVSVGQTFVPSNFAYGQVEGAQPSEPRLTQVETTVLRHLGEGLANKEIAFRLQMSESTVKMHVRTICRKLGARNRTHAVIMGRADGLL